MALLFDQQIDDFGIEDFYSNSVIDHNFWIGDEEKVGFLCSLKKRGWGGPTTR